MIDSILYQNYNLNKIIELIVLDDNSENSISDLILNFLKKISNISKNNKIINRFRFVYYKHSTNKGEFSNTNYGIKVSNGIWKFILHDDDYILPNFLILYLLI